MQPFRGELGVITQAGVAFQPRRFVAIGQFKFQVRLVPLPPDEPLGIVHQRTLQRPQVRRVGEVGLPDPLRRESPSDRLEELFAVLLQERLEERHTEHLPFALVNARREKIVDVVAEQVSVQERPATVSLHEQLDGRLLLSLTAEDLRDDALHLAAIALIEQARRPVRQCLARDDQSGEMSHPASDQLARPDGLAVRPPKLGPRDHVGQHQPHHARRVGTQRNAAAIETVIGNRQPIAVTGIEPVLDRHGEVSKHDPLVVRVSQRIEAIRFQMELVGLFVRKIDDEDRRLALD